MTCEDAQAILELDESYSRRAIAEFIALMRPDLVILLGWSVASARGNQLFGDEVLAAARAVLDKYGKDKG